MKNIDDVVMASGIRVVTHRNQKQDSIEQQSLAWNACIVGAIPSDELRLD